MRLLGFDLGCEGFRREDGVICAGDYLLLCETAPDDIEIGARSYWWRSRLVRHWNVRSLVRLSMFDVDYAYRWCYISSIAVAFEPPDMSCSY